MYPTPASAIVVFVLGVAGWVVLWGGVSDPVWAVIPSVAAVTQARKAQRDVTRVGGNTYGRGLIVAGVVLAWVALGFSAVFAVQAV